MAQDIQGLLEKIHTDGIAKTQQEREKILNDTKVEAAKIIADAQKEADALIVKAKAESEANQKKAADAIRQAARDAVIALRSNLLAKLNTVAHDCIKDAMTPDTMKQIILEMAKAYAANAGSASSIELLLPKKDQDKTADFLKNALLAELKAHPEIRLTNDFNSGLQISFKDSDVFFDFSDEALAEVLCKFVGTKLAAVIKD